jgi:site-specific DNA recombinase
VDQNVFTARSAEMKTEIERLRERLADARPPRGEVGQHVLAIFDFAQDAAHAWTVSGKDARRAILGRVLLKRSLSAISILTTKRKPFDVLAEGLTSVEDRGDWI